MKLYLIDAAQLVTLRLAADRLTEDRMTGDEMRDMARALAAVHASCLEMPARLR